MQKGPEQIQFWRWKQKSKASMTLALLLVDSKGIEPSTLRMRTVRSPKLSYEPGYEIFEMGTA